MANSTLNVSKALIEDLGFGCELEGRARKGGGTGVIFNENIKILEKKSKSAKTFEALKVKVQVKNKTVLNFTNLYRPPPSKKNKYSYKDFEVEYEKLLSSDECKMNDYHLGDYNIHLEKQDDPDTISFKNLLEHYGHKQLVTSSTHVKGDILDLVITNNDNHNYNLKVGDRFTSSDQYPCIN